MSVAVLKVTNHANQTKERASNGIAKEESATNRAFFTEGMNTNPLDAH
jgi:hypothetical protein